MTAETDFCALRAAGLPHVAWLDSATTDARLATRSLLAAAPTHTFVVWPDGRATLRSPDGETQFDADCDPFALLADLTRDRDDDALWLGYFGYDLKNKLERLPPPRADATGLPLAWWGRFAWWIDYDHAAGTRRIVGSAPWHVIGPAPTAASRGRESPVGALPTTFRCSLRDAASIIATSSFGSRAAHEAAVARTIEYVRDGDIFQANIAQRFAVPISGDPAALYLALRRRNPAPFAAFIDLGDNRALLSSSPERLLRVDGDRVQTRPIKGTRPRIDGDDAGNAAREAELLASEKDRAELAMIVDLARNDLGRVCRVGSVRVDDAATLERYATVCHLVATVSGRLAPGLGPFDAVRAAFPGGSISGAPKIRAMEIIDELEPVARGAWTGSIGYLAPDNTADFNIAIRTISLGNGLATFHAGGGITADSVPADEYDETLAKVRGITAALLEGE